MLALGRRKTCGAARAERRARVWALSGLLAVLLQARLARPAEPEAEPAATPLPARLTLTEPRLGRAGTAGEAAGSEPDPGTFLDIQGRRRSFSEVYRPWFGEYSQERHYARAFAEVSVLVGLGLLNYWVRPGLNRNDWDLPGVTQRLNFQAVRFDNNSAVTNFSGHPLAGSAYYGFSRLNGLTVPESAMLSIAASGFWEYVLEWREQVSINDMIFTPAGGMPLGAFFYQLADYLGSAPGGGTTASDAASYTLGFPRRIHPRDVDPNAGDARLPADSLGYSSAFWHSFRVGYDAAFVRADSSERQVLHTAVLDGWLVAMPGFLRPGRFHRIFASDNFTEIHTRLGFDADGFEDTDLRGEATLVGYYTQNFEAAPHGATGHAEMFGIGPGLRYVERYYGGMHDMYASTHLFNMDGALWFRLGALTGHLSSDLRYDFAAVRSLPLAEYRAAHGDESLKSVLTVQGYQYGAGVGELLRADLSYSLASAGGYVDHGWYRAIGGLDRSQDEMRGDVDGSEEITEYGVWGLVELPFVPIYVRGFADFVRRESTLGELRVRRIDERYGFGTGFVF